MDLALLAIIYLICISIGRFGSRSSFTLNTVMYVYLGGVLYFTLMPILASLPYCFEHSYVPMNMTPFRDVIMGYGDYERQITLNVIMTVPFGVLLPMCRNAACKSCSFIMCILSTAMLSLCIELFQPLISVSRTSDITDLITNTVGGAVGYIAYRCFEKLRACF